MKLGRKDYTISVKTGTDANKAKFKKECVQGEIYHATDTGFFYIAEVSAGASDATLSKFGATPFTNQYSVSFDGTDDMITIPQGTFNLGTGNWTFSFWFRPTGITSTSETIFMVKGTSGKYLAGFIQSGAFMLSDWNNTTLSYSTTLADNTWYHGAYIKNGSGSTDLHLYLNGTKVLEGNHPVTSDYGNDTATTRIGEIQTIGSYSFPFQGQIDEFAFWNSALSDGGVSVGSPAQGDIANIYNSGVPNDIGTNGLNLNPVGWWRMGDGTEAGSGTTVYDMSSNSNNGTLTNGPTFSTTVPS